MFITRKGSGDNTLTLMGEGGSNKTFREYAGFLGGNSKSNYSFSLSRADISGLSQADKAPGTAKEPEKDGYENTSATANIGGAVLTDAWLSIALRYSDALADIDDAGYTDDPNHTQRTRQFSAVTALDQEFTTWWRHSLIVNYMSMLRNISDGEDNVDTSFFNGWYQGSHRRLEWRHTFKIGNVDEISAGVEYQDEIMSSLAHSTWSTSSIDEEKVHAIAAYAQNHLKLFERVFFIAGMRVTDHEYFGSHLDYQLSASVITPLTETRFKGNYATGFKAPTLYQLYVDDSMAKGSRDLDPEVSVSYDFGAEQPLWSGKIILEASYFRTDYDNLIGTEGIQYVNKKDSKMEGYEGTLSFSPFRELRIAGSYTFLKTASEEGDDRRLIRRPKHQGSLYVNVFLLDRINLNMAMIYTGERDDDFFDPNPPYDSERRTMDDYLLFNAAVSVNFMEKFQVFARCENITDERYQDVLGYKRPGRSFYGGAKGTF